MKIEGQTCEQFIDANFGNGYATYALVNGEWYSVNLNGMVVMDVRWKASAYEMDMITDTLTFESVSPCKDDSCDAAHCPMCGGHKLEWYSTGLCSECSEQLTKTEP